MGGNRTLERETMYGSIGGQLRFERGAMHNGAVVGMALVSGAILALSHMPAMCELML